MMGLRGKVVGILGERGASQTSQLLRSTTLTNVHRTQAQVEHVEPLLGEDTA